MSGQNMTTNKLGNNVRPRRHSYFSWQQYLRVKVVTLSTQPTWEMSIKNVGQHQGYDRKC